MERVQTSEVSTMSDLYRSTLAANLNRISHLPTVAPFAADGRTGEVEESEEEENDSLGSLPS